VRLFGGGGLAPGVVLLPRGYTNGTALLSRGIEREAHGPSCTRRGSASSARVERASGDSAARSSSMNGRRRPGDVRDAEWAAGGQLTWRRDQRPSAAPPPASKSAEGSVGSSYSGGGPFGVTALPLAHAAPSDTSAAPVTIAARFRDTPRKTNTAAFCPTQCPRTRRKETKARAKRGAPASESAGAGALRLVRGTTTR
jgi:hypothetical protein